MINLNRRALDNIPESVVAVGTIKVFASPAKDEEPEDVWRWEIHEIISCSSRDLIDDALNLEGSVRSRSREGAASTYNATSLKPD